MMAAWFSRKHAVRTGAYGVGVVGTVGLAVFLGAGRGYPAQSVHLLPGSAWLASSQAGQLTLLDGASAEVAAQVQAAPAGHVLDVVQQGSTAYAIDETAGTLRRVDGATFSLNAPVTPIAGATSGLTAFADPQHVYALDSHRGLLTTADPHTLATTGTPLSLAAQLSAGAATLDDVGRLWLVDDGTGDLTRVADGTSEVHRSVAGPGKDLLTVVNGKPVVVDTAGRRAITVNPADGAPTGTLDLDLRPSDTVAVSGSPHSDRLYVVVSRGVLDICDLSAHDCSGVVALDGGGNDLGAAVESGDRVFVPDYTTGQVWVIDLTRNTIVATAQVLSPAAKFQLLTRDGIVFFNDPNSERAGVISLDGAVTRIAKYDPADPSKGLVGRLNPDPDPHQAPASLPPVEPSSLPPSRTPPNIPSSSPNRPSSPSSPPSPSIPSSPQTPPVQPTPPSLPPTSTFSQPGQGTAPPPSTPQPTGPPSLPSVPSTPRSSASSSPSSNPPPTTSSSTPAPTVSTTPTPTLPSTPSGPPESPTSTPSFPPPSTGPTDSPTTLPTTKPPATLKLTLSIPSPVFGQIENLAVAADDGTPVGSAQWNFGDNQSGGGANVSHAWTQPPGVSEQTYQVTVSVTLTDGRTAQTGLSLTVHVATVAVPNVIGDSASDAEKQITGAGLNYVVQNQTSTTVQPGQVLAQSPQGGGNAAWGATVTLTVSAAQPVVIDSVPAGFAVFRSGCSSFTDTRESCDFLGPYPQFWVY
ncbi:hypothetical protein ABH935_003465 [Catenulispora sp. GAS73]|uniref:PASTA domain-containing protein n=1 Tax=Catenulispora sp. GAS73 TaxID=3156269 RepID=UPI003514C520